MKILSSTVAALCTIGLALSSGHYAEAAAATRGRASAGAVVPRHGSSVNAGNGKFGSLPKHGPFNTQQQDEDQAEEVMLLDQEHRFLVLNVINVPCQNSILNFAEYAVTAALLAIPGFPASVAALVARALIKSIPVADIASAIDTLISKASPTPADFAAAFASIIATLTAGGFLNPDKILAAVLAELASLPLFEQIDLAAALATAFAGGGTPTIDPGQLDALGLLAKAQESIPIIIDKCIGEPEPTAAPVKPPTPAPVSFPWWCFSGKTRVQVKLPEGTIVHKRMDALKIGDMVQTADETYSKVYSFGHKAASSKAMYLQIFSASMDNTRPLEITAEHLIYTHDASKNAPVLVAAGDLRVGDRLVTANGSPSTILWIREVGRQGVYAPFTDSGNLLVNGVLASSYVSHDWLKDRVSGSTLHKLQHGAMLPLRFVCTVVANCATERYDETSGFSTYAHFLFRVEEWMLTLPTFSKTGFLLLLALPAMLIMLLGNLSDTPWHLLMVHVVAAVVGYYVWKRANRKDNGDNVEKKEGAKV